MNLRDSLFIIGFVVAAVGLWWVHPPTALIVIGVVIAGAGVLSHFSNRPKDSQ